MSSYDFITDNITFSYSSSSTFDTCAYSFKLSYIDSMPRKNNFYAEYGTLVHECMEKYFKNELEAFELSDYYKENFNLVVKTDPPPYPAGMTEKYRQQGQDFFDFFYFDKSDYDTLVVEAKLFLDINGIRFIAKPDLVLHNKTSGQNILVDYKTSMPYKKDKKTGELKADLAKINGYYKQMYTYVYALRDQMGINIDKITLWFPRADKTHSVLCTKEDEESAIDWITNTVDKIKNEENFPYNNTNNYFCSNLCNVRDFCEYW